MYKIVFKVGCHSFDKGYGEVPQIQLPVPRIQKDGESLPYTMPFAGLDVFLGIFGKWTQDSTT